MKRQSKAVASPRGPGHNKSKGSDDALATAQKSKFVLVGMLLIGVVVFMSKLSGSNFNFDFNDKAEVFGAWLSCSLTERAPVPAIEDAFKFFLQSNQMPDVKNAIHSMSHLAEIQCGFPTVLYLGLR